MSKMFAEPDLETMQRVRCAFDPEHLSNPTKIFPRPRLCGETPGEYRPHPLEDRRNRGTLLRWPRRPQLPVKRGRHRGSVGRSAWQSSGAEHLRAAGARATRRWSPAADGLRARQRDRTGRRAALRQRRGLGVVPRGGGTKSGWGNPPVRADLILSTARLNRVIEHAWADLTVSVEAGCTIQNLQSDSRAARPARCSGSVMARASHRRRNPFDE